MARIDFSQVTYTPGQIDQLSEVFFESLFKVTPLEQFHTIVTGIKAKKGVLYFGELGLSGKKQTGCDWVPNPGTVSATEKQWDPSYIGDRFEECFTDLLGTYFEWDLKNGVEKPDLTNTKFSMFLEERVGRSMQDAVLRHAWLGNTAAENVADGGYLKNGINPEYFDAIDGFWVQLLQIVTADATKRITISRNTGNSYANQKFTAQDTTDGVATAIFEDMIFGADMRLRDQDNKVIIATQSLVDQYTKERRKNDKIEVSWIRVENGWDHIIIDNIPVIPFNFLDRNIRAYEDNGTKWNNPHRAVLSTKENLQVGVEEVGNLSELDPFYDKKSKKYIVDYAFNLDAMIARDEMVMVAY